MCLFYHSHFNEQTFSGAVVHRHPSSVISAVTQLLTRVKLVCGLPLVRYWNSRGSIGKSAVLHAGVRHMFVHTSVARQPRSDTARPD